MDFWSWTTLLDSFLFASSMEALSLLYATEYESADDFSILLAVLEVDFFILL